MRAVAEFREVRKVYPGRTEALRGVDLSIVSSMGLGLAMQHMHSSHDPASYRPSLRLTVE